MWFASLASSRSPAHRALITPKNRVLQGVMTTTITFANLSDQELLAETKRLAAAERLSTVALIRSLMELDARRLYLGEGCASLFTYCTEVLQLSEDAAYNRIEVARAARRFPAMLDELERGALTLTAARRLSAHLTDANCVDVLAAARGKRKAEIEELIGTLHPRPDVKPMIRKMPQPQIPLDSRSVTQAPAPSEPPAPIPVIAAPSVPHSMVTTLAPERFKIQFTIGRDTRDKLREVQDLLRHSVRSDDLAEIFDRALTLLLKDARRQRFAETTAPRGERALVPGSRRIPAAVQRTVWKRDEGRCTFVGSNGRCTETSLLQFHHEEPFAVGGPPTVENIHLRCAAHNRYEAELFFGWSDPEVVREECPDWPVG